MYETLRRKIKEQYGTYAEFAGQVGLNANSFSSKINGHCKFKPSEKTKIANALNEYETLLFEDEPDSLTEKTGVVG